MLRLSLHISERKKMQLIIYSLFIVIFNVLWLYKNYIIVYLTLTNKFLFKTNQD